jgi:hypothetical protein
MHCLRECCSAVILLLHLLCRRQDARGGARGARLEPRTGIRLRGSGKQHMHVLVQQLALQSECSHGCNAVYACELLLQLCYCVLQG